MGKVSFHNGEYTQSRSLKSLFCAGYLDKAHETELLIRKFLPIFYRKEGEKSTILNKKKRFNCE